MYNPKINTIEEINNLKSLIEIIINALFINKNNKLVLKNFNSDETENKINIIRNDLEEIKIKIGKEKIEPKHKMIDLSNVKNIPENINDHSIKQHVKLLENNIFNKKSQVVIKKNFLNYEKNDSIVSSDDIFVGLGHKMRSYESNKSDYSDNYIGKIRLLTIELEKLKQKLFLMEKTDMASNFDYVKYNEILSKVTELQKGYNSLKIYIDNKVIDINKIINKVNLLENKEILFDVDDFSSRLVTINSILSNNVVELERYKKDNNRFIHNFREEIVNKLDNLIVSTSYSEKSDTEIFEPQKPKRILQGEEFDDERINELEVSFEKFKNEWKDYDVIIENLKNIINDICNKIIKFEINWNDSESKINEVYKKMNDELLIVYSIENMESEKPMFFNKTNHNMIVTEDISLKSDRRLKENIKKIDKNYLDKFMEIQGVTYNWKRNAVKDIGFIAQDVEKLFPDLVEKDEEGIKSLKYHKFIPILTECVKKQSREISFLKKVVIGLIFVNFYFICK